MDWCLMDLLMGRSQLERRASLGLAILMSVAILDTLMPTGQPTQAKTLPTTTATRALISRCACQFARSPTN